MYEKVAVLNDIECMHVSMYVCMYVCSVTSSRCLSHTRMHCVYTIIALIDKTRQVAATLIKAHQAKITSDRQPRCQKGDKEDKLKEYRQLQQRVAETAKQMETRRLTVGTTAMRSMHSLSLCALLAILFCKVFYITLIVITRDNNIMNMQQYLAIQKMQ